jgi:predicted dehydrogenase/threonine dehydrogenase-like Zn-dependent dehydrogenase
MKQVLIRRGRVTVENIPAPLIEQGHVLVEVAYSLISTGTELSSVQSSGQSLIKKALDQPEKVKKLWDYLRSQGIQKTVAKIKGQIGQAAPLGYSCSGFVIQSGEGISDLKPGDQVACAGAGVANHAEIVLVSRNLIVKVPEGCSLKDASSMTLGAIAMQGVRRADPRLGEIVAVIGLGLLGQITVQLLKAAGCMVIGIDLDARRMSLAKQVGADAAFNPTEKDINNEIRHLTGDHGVDATIITAVSNSNAIVQQAMEITRKKGRVVVVGTVGLGLNRSPFYEKEIDFLISCSYGPGRYDDRYEEKGLDYPYAYVRWTENHNMQEYLRLVAGENVRLGPILEREYELSQAPQAYEELRNASEKPLGVILRYPLIINESTKTKKLESKVVLRSRTIRGKVKIAVVGAGNFAKAVQLRNLQRLSDFYHLSAIVDIVGVNAKSAAEQFKADYVSTNYEDVLADPDVDAVLICTRHNLHAQQAIQAAKAGKGILLEKPMALNQVELDKLITVLWETGVPFMMGFNRRFSPAATRAKELTRHRTNPLIVIYRVNAGYIPLDNWVHGEEGGGRIIGEACHMFDLFNYFTEAEVESIDVRAISPKSEHVSSTDNFVATLKCADGSICTLMYTALGANEVGKEYIEIYCDGKTLLIDDFKELRVYGTKGTGWKGPQDKGHLLELEEFARLVRGGGPWPISLDELVRATEISFLVNAEVKP